MSRIDPNHPHGDIEAHRKYLAQVPRDEVQRRLEVFHLKEEVMEQLPIVCQSFEVRPDDEVYQPWLHPLDPISLDDVKNWYGVPNETARFQANAVRERTGGDRHWGRMKPVDHVHLPATRRFDFGSLEPVQQAAVRQMATNLLYGYVDPDEARRLPYAAVIEYMIDRARGLTAFVCPDLVVCPDDVVVLKSIPVAIFNNILIYDTGEIVTKHHTAIHAFQLQHVDTP